jgi:hypothetical protein
MLETDGNDSTLGQSPTGVDLQRGLRDALSWALGRSPGGLVSVTVALPPAPSAGCAVPANGFAWSRPSRRHELAGYGAAAMATAAGEDRFDRLAESHAGLVGNWETRRPGRPTPESPSRASPSIPGNIPVPTGTDSRTPS